MAITNRFAKACKRCGQLVPVGEGISETNAAGRWETFHHPGDCPAEADRVPTFTDAARPEPNASDLSEAADEIVNAVSKRFLELVPELVATEVQQLSPRVLEIKAPKLPKITIQHSHKALPDILLAVAAGGSPMLVGPAGSGKTTLGMQVATALRRKFYMAARVTSEYKLVGFVNATGDYVRTQFRDAYEHGGVFLFDEIDASDPDALTAFNAALANGIGDFPDGMVTVHEDFVAIAAANTFGRGADRQYVGRNQLDAATLDRFQTFEVDYDEQLELMLARNDEWTRWVQRVRAAIDEEKVRHIVSPRASINGAKMLAAGMERSVVEAACVWKGLDDQAKRRVLAKVPPSVLPSLDDDVPF